MDLTACGLLVDRAEELTQRYAEHGNWNDVKDVWFDERLANRSTRGSSQKIYRILTSRFKNAPPALPNPSALPAIFDRCATSQDKAQILYLYLVADDLLVQYVVSEYVDRLQNAVAEPLEFSNNTLNQILSQLEYVDRTRFDYAASTTERWCAGFRSVMREIGALGGHQSTLGKQPSIGDTPLLVSMDYSFGVDDEEWIAAPRGLLYLFQSESRWKELFDRAASTDAWEYLELHGALTLRPTDSPYSWVQDGGAV
ncbi:DUF1819 family protein [Halalkalirubrum salinum]|uniref:DUF1819 family protein n=1 Tax=Halalkalirubrum salinum TaxID=2563889 RepID=UPI00197B05E0|nr:DUF1819 family protein [Halalkalirubrum salinum]